MKMNRAFFLSVGFLVALCFSCAPSTSEPTTEPTSDPSISEPSTEPSEEINYGELIVPDATIYTNFPDVVFPTFTNPEYASEITYTIENEKVVKYENGYFVALKAGSTGVTATTPYHETEFVINTVAYADAKGGNTTNWYLGRISSVESRWINDGKPTGGTLFIGDSFFDTEFWSDFYTLYKDNDRVYTHGVSSSTTTDWELFAKRLVYPVAPDNIVMHLGTNNIYDDYETAEAVITNTKRLLEDFQTRLPETKVYYFAIEPRTYNPGGGNFTQTTYDKITAVNTAMKEYCDNNDKMVFVDATSYCYTSGITVNADFFRDGTHPKLENYLIYANLLKDAGLDLTINPSYLNTTEFSIAQSTQIAATNTLVRVNGETLKNNYSLKGKMKIGTSGTNPHIQFSLDETNFQNRYLVWDNDTNGVYNAGYAYAGDHKAASGSAAVKANEEIKWEVVTTEKHSYFYVNDVLQFIFLNINAKTLIIGAENVAVDFYDIEAITSYDADAYASVLAREEIAQYESSTDTSKKAIIA